MCDFDAERQIEYLERKCNSTELGIGLHEFNVSKEDLMDMIYKRENPRIRNVKYGIAHIADPSWIFRFSILHDLEWLNVHFFPWQENYGYFVMSRETLS